MPFIDTYGLPEINFVRTGPRGGRPLVFLHPVGLDLTWWGSQIEEFGSDHDVIALDMPGHGLSGKLSGPPTFDLMSEVVQAVLENLDAGPVHLVGVSVGGMIAQKFALRRPELVQSLTLVATLCTFPDEARVALRGRASAARMQGMIRIAELSNERWFPSSFRKRRPDIIDRATKCLLSQDAEFHASMWDMIAGLDLASTISAIRCPTLVVAGTEDGNAPVAAAKRISDLIAGASLEEMSGVGHFPPFESPAAFNALLRRFLANVGKPQS